MLTNFVFSIVQKSRQFEKLNSLFDIEMPLKSFQIDVTLEFVDLWSMAQSANETSCLML